jgi:hypothetical protein
MAALEVPMIPDVPIDGPAVLALEKKVRSTGTGLEANHLSGSWLLSRTWSRRGKSSPQSTDFLLRAVNASLFLERQGEDLAIANQISVGPFCLRFDGQAKLQGQRPLLIFSFNRMSLLVGTHRLLKQDLPAPKPERMPFFALIGCGSDGSWLCARGRGGGLAVWSRDHKDESDLTPRPMQSRDA